MLTPATTAAHPALPGEQSRTKENGAKPIVLIFANFGFYHLARMQALAEILPVTAIELAAVQKLYGWRVDKSGHNIITLHEGALEERVSFWGRLRLTVSLWRVLNSIQPRALLIPGYSDLCCLAAAVWGRLRHARTVLMLESTEIDRPRIRAKEFIKKTLVKVLFDFGFVGGQRTMSYLEKLGMDARRIEPAYDVVDNAFFTRGADKARDTLSPADFGLPSHYFLYVGRLSPEKNLPRLLNAFRYYLDHGGSWPLILVGMGPREQELRRTAESLGIAEAVQFAGFKNGRDLFPYYAFASCFVLPSIREPWGLVVNEAMASGLPTLVSNRCGCAPELVATGINGYVFDPLEESDLAGKLLRMSSLPEEERAAMGLASLRIISGFSPARWAESAAKVLSQPD